MATTVPKLSLTHGQVVYALSRGSAPDPVMIDQIRYLRQLGVPFGKYELGVGRGNRVRYRYEHLIELGVALWGLERGIKPKEVVKFLVEQRRYLRELYAKAFSEMPETTLQRSWVKSRGRIIPMMEDEVFLRFHDRYSEAPGRIETLGPDDVKDLNKLFVTAEKYPGAKARMLLPLTRLAFELVAWALEAPELKPGP
jgi:hypothetical protein